MKKSKFRLSALHSTTGNAGYLIPFLLQPTLPNDTFRISLTSFIRAQPMLAPLMHEVKFYTQYWFVPNRLIWSDWEQFITGGSDLTFTAEVPELPSGTTFDVGSLGDYFGYPIGVDCGGISILPFRAYNLIWNNRYRDEDLQQEIPVSFDSGTDSTTSLELKSPSWKKDYFTTARASVQRGSEIQVPVNGIIDGAAETYYNAIYGTIGSFTISASGEYDGIGSGNTWTISNIEYSSDTQVWVTVRASRYTTDVDASSPTYRSQTFRIQVPFTKTGDLVAQPDAYVAQWSTSGSFSNSYTSQYFLSTTFSGTITVSVLPSGSYTAQEVGSFSIRDLRASSALQRYAERSLEWGNRYEEFIQREFGIKPRDARIQRPEYLGGGKGTLQISEVLQTAEGSNTGVGTMRGHGIAGISQRPIRFRSPEHGWIIGLLSIRPVPVYTQGVIRELLKKSRLDFFTPELANIGMQEVLQRELFVSDDNADTIFGYSDRYQEYRYNMPKVTGEFRSTLDFWNMARQFESAPVINDSFIDMSSSSSAFYRPFASQSTHQYLMMLRNNILAYRPIPKRARNILK